MEVRPGEVGCLPRTPGKEATRKCHCETLQLFLKRTTKGRAFRPEKIVVNRPSWPRFHPHDSPKSLSLIPRGGSCCAAASFVRGVRRVPELAAPEAVAEGLPARFAQFRAAFGSRQWRHLAVVAELRIPRLEAWGVSHPLQDDLLVTHR